MFKRDLVLSFFFIILLRSSKADTYKESQFIKSVSDKLNCKFILLLTSNKNLETNYYKFLNIQKNLNSKLLYFTSILSFGSLTESLVMNARTGALVVMYWNKETLQDLILVSQRIKMWNFKWLCLSFSQALNDLDFQSVLIPFRTEFIYVDFACGKAILKEIYQFSNDSKKMVNYFGNWSSSSGLITVEGDLYNRRRNLSQTTLRYVLVNTSDPFNPCSLPWIADPYVLECIYFRTWNDLSITFNFTSKYIIVSPLYENGTRGFSSPTLDKIHSSEAESLMEPIVISSSRLLLNDFLWPLSYSTGNIFTMVPEVEINFSSYLQPFSFKLWMATLAWLALMSIISTTFRFIIVKVMQKRHFGFLKDCAEDTMASLTIMCSQSVAVEQKHMVSIRMLIIIINAVPLLLMPAYSGGLTSSLANLPQRIPFLNLKEFAADGRYKLCARKHSYTHTVLQSDSRFLTARKQNLVWENSEMPESDENGFNIICKMKMSFVANQPAFPRVTPRCKLFTMEDDLGIFYASMPVRKNFPFLDLFNRVLQRRHSAGIFLKEIEKTVLEKLKIRFSMRTLQNSHVEKSDFNKVKAFDFEDVLPLFTVLLGGFTLTIVVFLLEIHHHRSKQVLL